MELTTNKEFLALLHEITTRCPYIPLRERHNRKHSPLPNGCHDFIGRYDPEEGYSVFIEVHRGHRFPAKSGGKKALLLNEYYQLYPLDGTDNQ